MRVMPRPSPPGVLHRYEPAVEVLSGVVCRLEQVQRESAAERATGVLADVEAELRSLLSRMAAAHAETTGQEYLAFTRTLTLLAAQTAAGRCAGRGQPEVVDAVLAAARTTLRRLRGSAPTRREKVTESHPRG